MFSIHIQVHVGHINEESIGLLYQRYPDTVLSNAGLPTKAGHHYTNKNGKYMYGDEATPNELSWFQLYFNFIVCSVRFRHEKTNYSGRLEPGVACTWWNH